MKEPGWTEAKLQVLHLSHASELNQVQSQGTMEVVDLGCRTRTRWMNSWTEEQTRRRQRENKMRPISMGD